jgi:hypothetical protein
MNPTMKTLFQLIVITVISISCSVEKDDSLSKDETINSVFNLSEISDLVKIQEFFDQQIGSKDKKNEGSLLKSYDAFFEGNSKIKNLGQLTLSIDFNEQKKLYKRLTDSTYNHIWIMSWTVPMNSVDTLNRLELKYGGKYMEFLEEVGGKDEKIAQYCNSFKGMGVITPSMTADLVKNYKDYNINDPKVRLIIAIHYLTMNDILNRVESKSVVNKS